MQWPAHKAWTEVLVLDLRPSLQCVLVPHVHVCVLNVECEECRARLSLHDSPFCPDPANQPKTDVQTPVARATNDPELLSWLVPGRDQRPRGHGRALLDTGHHHSRPGESRARRQLLQLSSKIRTPLDSTGNYESDLLLFRSVSTSRKFWIRWRPWRSRQTKKSTTKFGRSSLTHKVFNH